MQAINFARRSCRAVIWCLSGALQTPRFFASQNKNGGIFIPPFSRLNLLQPAVNDAYYSAVGTIATALSAVPAMLVLYLWMKLPE